MKKRMLSLELERTVARASSEAKAMGHSRVGSEHLLLALLHRRQSAAALLLQTQGWDAESLRVLLRRRCGTGKANLPLVQGLSPAAVCAIRRAGEAAGSFGHDRVEPEHLLLALVRDWDSTAARLLRENGTCLNCVFTDLYMSLDGEAPLRRPVEERWSMRLLEQFCEDMVTKSCKMDPVVGRDEEIDTVLSILSRKGKNNPALVGEPGVGKTAIVEGLAKRMAEGRIPEQLQGKRLLSLNMASVLAGTKYRGEFEERVRDIVSEIRRSGNVILFVDEMHTLVGAGAAEGAIDAANLLKPALGRGEIQIIGATTLEEYRKHIEKDAALERRFRPVTVREPSRADTLTMLEGLRPGLEKHHNIRIGSDAMEAAVELSCRYLTDRFLPDKAVDLLDEAAARSRMKQEDPSSEQTRIRLSRELSLAVQENRFEQAARLRDRLQQVTRQQRGIFRRQMVEWEDVAATVSRRTGIPVGRISQSDRQRLLHLKEDLNRQIWGQAAAVEAVASAVCRGRLGLADGDRPVASLLFLGPTGVGKTALCKALADCVYGSRDAMVRLDMSEYMEQHAVSRLLGAPPGYIGHGEGGELTERVRRRPYCVVLLDELEKAHRDVTSILLQILEDGVLTDSMGRKADFRNAIVVMTSNLGSGRTGLDRMGFLQSGSDPAQKALREYFSPELLGRIDCVTTFRPLDRQTLRSIAEAELAQTVARAEKAGAALRLSVDTADCLAGQCVGSPSGARELRRRIRSDIEAPVAEALLQAEQGLKLQTRTEQGRILVEAAGE